MSREKRGFHLFARDFTIGPLCGKAAGLVRDRDALYLIDGVSGLDSGQTTVFRLWRH